MAGFHILPRMLAEKLNLTDDQKTQIAELEKETKAKLDKILTVDQQKMLDEFRPMHRGMGGPGMGGPGMEGGHEGHDGPGAPGEGGQTPPPPAN
jgi:hypothetical protein